jgi:uncharacterized protein (DUF934 family)
MTTMKLIAAAAGNDWAGGTFDPKNSLKIANDTDPRELALDGVQRIELDFPKFTDGRAYSQAFLLKCRLGFKGEIVATGDVLIDQLAQMQRSGFTVAVLRADQPLDVAERVLASYPGYVVGAYQGDALKGSSRLSHPAPGVAA